MHTNLKHPGWPKMIETLQRRCHMTQGQIGREVGLSQNFLSNVKNGKRASIQYEPGLKLFGLYARRVLGRKLALVQTQKERRAA